jgi:hypothetical protein
MNVTVSTFCSYKCIMELNHLSLSFTSSYTLLTVKGDTSFLFLLFWQLRFLSLDVLAEFFFNVINPTYSRDTYGSSFLLLSSLNIYCMESHDFLSKWANHFICCLCMYSRIGSMPNLSLTTLFLIRSLLVTRTAFLKHRISVVTSF